MPKSDDERFWSKVNKDGPIVRAELGQCWIWVAAKDSHGYGLFSIGGHGRSMLAHRYIVQCVVGPLSKSMHVLHKCDNPPCVRFAHLYVGNHLKNMADKVERGRAPRGERQSQHKLSWPEVIEIRRKRAEGIGYTALAKQFGVSGWTIYKIIHHQRWKKQASHTSAMVATENC